MKFKNTAEKQYPSRFKKKPSHSLKTSNSQKPTTTNGKLTEKNLKSNCLDINLDNPLPSPIPNETLIANEIAQTIISEIITASTWKTIREKVTCLKVETILAGSARAQTIEAECKVAEPKTTTITGESDESNNRNRKSRTVTNRSNWSKMENCKSNLSIEQSKEEYQIADEQGLNVLADNKENLESNALNSSNLKETKSLNPISQAYSKSKDKYDINNSSKRKHNNTIKKRERKEELKKRNRNIKLLQAYKEKHNNNITYEEKEKPILGRKPHRHCKIKRVYNAKKMKKSMKSKIASNKSTESWTTANEKSKTGKGKKRDIKKIRKDHDTKKKQKGKKHRIKHNSKESSKSGIEITLKRKVSSKRSKEEIEMRKK
jgi:hypothetical protein